MKEKVLMEDIVNLCKQYGFVYQGSEIYGGFANTWDFGPLGVELINNVKHAWWKRFVNEDFRTYGVDAGALGIFDSSYCKDLNELRNDDDVKVIDVHDADSHTIKLSYEDGTFTFYIDNDNVEEIYTGDPQEDDEYDEETDSDDYLYDENDDEDLY